LGHPGAQELLRTPGPARLAYTGGDEFPRVIPMGFHWDGERLVVCTAPTAPKVSALAARPHVALTIDTDEAPFKALLIRGVAEVEVVNGVAPEYIAASAKSDGRPVVGDVRGAGSWRVQADGQDLDYAAMGAVLRLRRRPPTGLPARAARN